MTTHDMTPQRARPRVAFLGCLGALALTAVGFAQDAPSWPDLPKAEEQKLTLRIRRLETTEGEANATALRETVAFGAAAVPHLLRRLALPKPSPNAIAGVRSALDQLVTDEHGDLILPLLDERALETRRWAAHWIAHHVDARYRDRLAALVAEPEEGKPKPKVAPDPEIAFHANLALAALKDRDALLKVMEVCHTEWQSRAPVVAAVLPRARSSEMARFVIGEMQPDDERSRVTGLRMMRYLAPKDYAGAMIGYLDAGEASVKREAINALRAIVDEAPPIEELSAFTAIQEAKKWKERLK